MRGCRLRGWRFGGDRVFACGDTGNGRLIGGDDRCKAHFSSGHLGGFEFVDQMCPFGRVAARFVGTHLSDDAVKRHMNPRRIGLVSGHPQ